MQKDVIAIQCIIDGSLLYIFLHDILHMRLSAGLAQLSLQG